MERAEVEATVKRIVAEELSMPPTQETEQVVGKRKNSIEGVTGNTLLGAAIFRVNDRLAFELGISFGGNVDPKKTVDDLINDIMESQ